MEWACSFLNTIQGRKQTRRGLNSHAMAKIKFRDPAGKGQSPRHLHARLHQSRRNRSTTFIKVMIDYLRERDINVNMKGVRGLRLTPRWKTLVFQFIQAHSVNRSLFWTVKHDNHTKLDARLNTQLASFELVSVSFPIRPSVQLFFGRGKNSLESRIS